MSHHVHRRKDGTTDRMSKNSISTSVHYVYLAETIKPLILEVQGLSKSSTLIRLKNLSLVLAVMSSMPMVIWNCFHEKLKNKSKITTFKGVPLFDALVCRFT